MKSEKLTYLFFDVLCVSLFLFFFFLSNAKGLNLTPDSEAYLSAAQYFSDTFSIPNWYKDWPPLYPILLSFGLSKIYHWAVFLNLFSIALSIIIWRVLAQIYIANNILKSLFLLMGCLSSSILAITHLVWSEAVFIMLISGFIYSYQREEKKWNFIFYVSGVLMCYQKNTAFFLLLGFTLASLIFDRNFKKIIPFLMVSFLGSFWNLYQVFQRDEISLITDLLPYLSVVRNMILTSSEISLWFLPFQFSQILGTVFFILILSFSIYIFSKYQIEKKWLIVGFAILIYIAHFFIIPVSEDDIARLMSPVIFPFLFLFFRVINFVFKKPFTTYILALLLVIISYNFVRIYKNANHYSLTCKLKP